MASVWTKLAVIVALFLSVILLNLAVAPDLYSISLELIRGYSETWDSSDFAGFMKVYTNLGALFFIVLSAVYVLQSGPKLKHILFVNTMALCLALNMFLKNLHHQLRPAWYDDKIPVIGSEHDFGTPSGHAANVGAAIGSALILYLFDNRDLYLTDSEFTAVTHSRAAALYSPVAKTVVATLAMGAYVLLIFSRVYLGAHAINQVLYGATLAAACVGTVFGIGRAELVRVFRDLLERKVGVSTKYWLATSTAVMLLPNVVLYLAGDGALLSEKTVTHVRSKIPDFDSDTPLAQGLLNSGFGAGLTGVNFGVLYSIAKYSIGQTRQSLPISEWKRWARLSVVLSMAGPCPLISYFVFPTKPVLAFFWLKSFLPMFLSAFLVFAFGDRVMELLGMLPDIETAELAAEDENGRRLPLLGAELRDIRVGA